MKLARFVTIGLASLVVGCGALVPQPGPTSPTPSPSKAPVTVPAVSEAVRSTLLLEDHSLVFKQNEQLPLAPDTFAITDNGDVMINDFLGDKLAIYHNGERAETYDKPTPVVDMAIRDGQIYLLDTSYTVTVYNPTKHGLKEIRTIALPPIKLGTQSEYSTLYFEGPNLIAQSDDPVLVEGPGPIQPEPKHELLDHTIHLTDGNTNALIPITYDDYSLDRIALTDEHVFYRVADSDTHNAKQMRWFIVQFDLNGNLIHTYAVYRRGSTAEGRKFVVANGNLYQMWISEKTVKVYQIHPTS